MGEHMMRSILAAMAVAVVVGFAGSANASGPATSTTVNASPANGIAVAQRCRCVERRWNGSCKLRVCRDHW
jgi:hypothetical protein